jgi:metallophosphoesterase superfamily enzyme
MDVLRVHDDWLLTPYRLAIHEPTATAVIADVHLGYSEARRRTGDAVPLPGVETALAPLARAARRLAFRRLVVAGDLFEQGYRPELYADFTALLGRLRIDWLGLVPGNHDRGLPADAALPVWRDGYPLGGWLVAHDEALAGRQVLGHYHPAGRHNGRKQPCYVVGPDRLVLPAFSRDAAGVDWTREPRWRDCQAVVIAGAELAEAGA